ncbi:MAG TPA: winged helix-turn-helix transcriptional regulator [Allosphingosinicella sp.]|jgi:DNA-binding HxlR family transcriptional regulator|nr:winged helix-turn-helix transcriptional regulator [Allosphingosinicella sp.]
MIGEAEFRRLTAGRWLLPLMAHVGALDGSRFAMMLARLGLSRSALAASLTQLQEAGWLARNPGHGHPLRPEYVLTPAGAPIAAFCQGVMAQRERLGLAPGQLPRWSLPLIATLGRDRARFSALRSALLPVTPRALSLTLKQMLSVDLVDRALEAEFPPVAIYGLTGRGRALAEAMR